MRNNTVDIAEELLDKLVGLNKVGLTYRKDGKLHPQEFFPSLGQAAKRRVSALLLDKTVNGFWVGAQRPIDNKLRALLHRINRKRGFGGVETGNKVATLWDLAL